MQKLKIIIVPLELYSLFGMGFNLAPVVDIKSLIRMIHIIKVNIIILVDIVFCGA